MKFLVLALCVVAAMADPHWVTLDAGEVSSVKHTWDSVRHSEVDILYNVFKAYPEIMARFPKFVGKNLDSLKGTANFAVHAGRIVGFFGEYIALLGSESNQAAIKTILNEMGHNHKNRGISKDMFNKFRTTVMGYLSSHGDAYNEHAWNDAFDKMYYVVFSNLDGKAVE